MYELILMYALSSSATLGPDFGTPPSFMRRKLVSVLSENGKSCCMIDDVAIVKRYAGGACHAIPVSSDDGALSKAKKEVENTVNHFVVNFNLYIDFNF